MPTLTACFDERALAARTCKALLAQFPGLRIAVHLASAAEEAGQDDHLRSLLVEIVGVSSAPANLAEQACPVEVVISDLSQEDAPAVRSMLLKHHAALRGEEP